MRRGRFRRLGASVASGVVSCGDQKLITAGGSTQQQVGYWFGKRRGLFGLGGIRVQVLSTCPLFLRFGAGAPSPACWHPGIHATVNIQENARDSRCRP